MAFEKLLSFTKDVSDLPDKPTLTPAELKAQFDAAPDEVRVYLNKLIDALVKTTAGDSGAKSIGATTISGLTGSNVQMLLESLANGKVSKTGDTMTSALTINAASSSAQFLVFNSPRPWVLQTDGDGIDNATSNLTFISTTSNKEFKIKNHTGHVSLKVVASEDPLIRGVVTGCKLMPDSDNIYRLGDVSNRWSQLYAGTTTIATSDERVKQQISAIPDSWLDAWADVELIRYKFNDAVSEKGDAARWHIGVIAQAIETAFNNHGVNAFEVGVLCYDEWIDENGVSQNLYSIRPDECQFLEMALMRRTQQRLEQRIVALEAK